MQEFFDIVSKWTPLGQGIFFLIVIGSLFVSVRYIFKMLAVMIRGWPPPEVKQDEEEE